MLLRLLFSNEKFCFCYTGANSEYHTVCSWRAYIYFQLPVVVFFCLFVSPKYKIEQPSVLKVTFSFFWVHELQSSHSVFQLFSSSYLKIIMWPNIYYVYIFPEPLNSLRRNTLNLEEQKHSIHEGRCNP